jgi:hypothetical protein
MEQKLHLSVVVQWLNPWYFYDAFVIQSKYKLYWHKLVKNKQEQEFQTLPAPINALFYILRILILICSYIFQNNSHPQGAYTNVVTTYSNKTVLQ